MADKRQLHRRIEAAFGQPWQAVLHRLVLVERKSHKQAARILQVHPSTVTRLLAELPDPWPAKEKEQHAPS